MKTTVGVYIFDVEGRLLVVHPTDHDNSWGIPKGMPDKDEIMVVTAIREVYEETGIDLSQGLDRMVYVGMEPYTHKKKILYAYTIKLKTPLDRELKCRSMFFSQVTGKESPEVDEFRWVWFDEFKENIQPEQVRLWERFRRKDKSVLTKYTGCCIV